MNEELNLQDNAEIQEALKEFDRKYSDVEQVQKTPEALKTPELPGMVRLVMKYSRGKITEQRTAEYVLLGFVVLIVIISLYLVFGSSLHNKKIPFRPAVGTELQH